MLTIRLARTRIKFKHLVMVMCSSDIFLCLSFRKQLSRKIPGPDLRDFCHRDMAAAGGGAAMLHTAPAAQTKCLLLLETHLK